jgi:tRNA(adenine34) deaminase
MSDHGIASQQSACYFSESFLGEAMDLALHEAEVALSKGEVPVGAVLVWRGQVLAKAHNLRESQTDPLAHAELLAISEAARRLGNWRLNEATLVVTLEPCPMCMGALLQARVPRLVYGAADPKAGAAGTLYDLSDDPRLNHRIEVTRGVGEGRAIQLLRQFFDGCREPGDEF